MAARVSLEGARAAQDDLGARILSAVALIPLAVGAALAGGPWLAGATGAAIVAMGYEWARMSEPAAMPAAWAFVAAGALGAVMLASWALFGWALVWLGVWAWASALRRRGLGPRLEAAGGVLYVGAPCAAFVWLRGLGEGTDVILTLFAIIWSVDVAAYFGGRVIGGPALWPAASPQKTWAGTACGLAVGLAAGFACGAALHGPVFLWGITGLVMGGCGLAGDLLESLLKRRFGVKDSSRLIPGHGGVLDRIDGLMLASCAAALCLAAAPALRIALWGHGS
jgi:phosphatidate cytidylyltransferase